MTESEKRVRRAVRSLQSLRDQFTGNGVVNRALVSTYEGARITLEEELDIDLSHLSADRLGSAGTRSVFVSGMYPAIDQILIAAEDAGAPLEDSNAGAVTTAPQLLDTDLSARCAGLLTGKGPFDRAVNQATQVLEVRLRTASGYSGSETGPNLVSRVLNNDPALALLRVSDVPAEQEGFANLCRGLMQYLRNPTHHAFKEITKDDATKIALFIDYALAQLATAKHRES